MEVGVRLMTRYSVGRRREQETVHYLRSEGYGTLRAAGSKGVFDVVGYNSAVVRFIQVKSSKAQYGSLRSDLESVNGAAVPEGATKELWVYEPRKLTVYHVKGPRVEYPINASVVFTAES